MVGFFFVNSIFFVIFIKVFRGESRAAATFKMECFVIIVNGWKPLTIVTKHSILDAAAALDPPLVLHFIWGGKRCFQHCIFCFIVCQTMVRNLLQTLNVGNRKSRNKLNSLSLFCTLMVSFFKLQNTEFEDDQTIYLLKKKTLIKEEMHDNSSPLILDTDIAKLKNESLVKRLS